jgi:hypothetical protein
MLDMFTQDFIINNGNSWSGQGEVGSVITPRAGSRFDPGIHKPYFDPKTGRPMVTVNTGRYKYDKKLGYEVPIKEEVLVRDLMDEGIWSPTFNATSLEKLQWIKLDSLIIAAARQRLRAWADLMAASPYGGFNGMGKTILEHQTMNDPGEAIVDMDGLSEIRSDARKFQLEGIPLPITHSGFRYNRRELEISRSSGIPLNVRDAEAAGRRIAEKLEDTVVGDVAGMDFGDSTDYSRASKVYGYTNYPDRATTTLTTPTGSNPEVTVANVLEMRDALYNNQFYGPFILYHSKDWDRYLDNDYARLGGSNANMTLRDRLRRIEGISDVRRLDRLDDTYTFILMEMSSNVAQAVNGMDITTIQWETHGGMQIHFKVLCIQVPRIFSDIDGNCGICHSHT